MYSLTITNKPADNKVINRLGSSVKIFLSDPIELDLKKKYQMRVLSANIVFCEPNITSTNNLFSYAVNGITYSYNIPIGLYGIDDINNIIARKTIAQNGSQLFAFVANPSTSTTIVYFAQPNTYIHLSEDSVMNILGFNTSGSIGGFLTTTGYVETSRSAMLNKLQLILIKCNITNGSYLNSDQSSIVAGVPISVSTPYSQIQEKFIHPTRNNIFVNRIDNLQIDLLDQDGNALDMTKGGTTPTENWNIIIDISEYDSKNLL